MILKTVEFDYRLPPERIAQRPPAGRTSSRLLVLNRETGEIAHRRFLDIKDYLNPGDCLVVNETKVRPARLNGRKETGAAIELLLLTERGPGEWEALAKPAKRLAEGVKIEFGDGLVGTVAEVLPEGRRLVRFSAPGPVGPLLESKGRPALPPYIKQRLDDPERYQTVFAAKPGSVAAPTAGLHFTAKYLSQLEDDGIKIAKLSLDIGLDTFKPIQAPRIEQHKMHSEMYDLPIKTAGVVEAARAAGRRVVAVGTTVVRALESAAAKGGRIEPGRRATRLFIRPGYKFRVVDALLTNFHLPKSTLIVLVSAFAGRENVFKAYGEAVAERYRFYSFGDAMFISNDCEIRANKKGR